jgi:hypothetical protein
MEIVKDAGEAVDQIARYGIGLRDEAKAKMFAFEPGNGTRYDMVLARFGDELLVAIINFRSAYTFTHGNQEPGYVAEKLRLDYGDAVPIAELINAQFK